MLNRSEAQVKHLLGSRIEEILHCALRTPFRRRPELAEGMTDLGDSAVFSMTEQGDFAHALL